MKRYSFSGMHASLQCRRRKSGVALIIVLGFLGLMVMMAVAFMVQARVERMVADSTLEGMRARQIAQTGIAGALQDYLNESIAELKGGNQPPELFLSGNRRVNTDSYHYSDLYVDNTNLWNGEAIDWLPAAFKSDDSRIDLDDVQDMEWIWVREKPGSRSRILGRYAYACFNLSGGVDANLLGRDYYDEQKTRDGYGSPTNRNNVRKMFLNSIPTKPSALPSSSTDRQWKLSQYQDMWKGFDTPVALSKLTDGSFNDGEEKGGPNSSKPNRWAQLGMDERDVGKIQTDYLSCYSYSTTYEGYGETEKVRLTRENINKFTKKSSFKQLVQKSHGKESDVIKAIEDYFDPGPTPQGTDYPSVKDVPMFNEIGVEVQLYKNDQTGDWQLKVTLSPEFWCPFPSKDTPDRTFTLPAPKLGGDGTPSGTTADIWFYSQGLASERKRFSPTLEQLSVDPPELEFRTSDITGATDGVKVPDKFVYELKIGGMPPNEDLSLPDVEQFYIRAINFVKPLELKCGSSAADSTPHDTLSMAISPQILNRSTGATTGSGYMEVEDPRLNHLASAWKVPDGDGGTLGKTNSCLASARNKAKDQMGYEPGQYMYCRNGDMLSPAELGYIPVYDGTAPWMTLDIFSDAGIDLMNTLVCDENVWKLIQENGVFFTNGTINPYTRDTPVYKGAFCGVDVSEVPNISGSTNTISDQTASEIADEAVKDKEPGGDAFRKDGPGGWTRVLRYKGFDFNKKDSHPFANKNERVALAHNTWGLFNESDSLFLVFVIAQSITEAPDKVQSEGNWDEDADMITGERRAVALCWMDTNTDESTDDTKREMDIIMFKYLNE